MTEEQRSKFATGYYNKRFLEEYKNVSTGTAIDYSGKKEYGITIKVKTYV